MPKKTTKDLLFFPAFCSLSWDVVCLKGGYECFLVPSASGIGDEVIIIFRFPKKSSTNFYSKSYSLYLSLDSWFYWTLFHPCARISPLRLKCLSLITSFY